MNKFQQDIKSRILPGYKLVLAVCASSQHQNKYLFISIKILQQCFLQKDVMRVLKNYRFDEGVNDCSMNSTASVMVAFKAHD